MYLLGSLERANLKLLTDPTEEVSPLLSENGNTSSFRNVVFSRFQKHSNPEFHIASSKPFRI
jgi:hypothetical protein